MPVNKQCNWHMLFSLMKQCFQEVGPTKEEPHLSLLPIQIEQDTPKPHWMPTRISWGACQVPNVGNQLMHRLRMAQKPTLVPMHNCMHWQVQLFWYLKQGLFWTMMELLTKQEKIKQIFSWLPKNHQKKYVETHKTLPDTSHSSGFLSSDKMLIIWVVSQSFEKREEWEGLEEVECHQNCRFIHLWPMQQNATLWPVSYWIVQSYYCYNYHNCHNWCNCNDHNEFNDHACNKQLHQYGHCNDHDNKHCSRTEKNDDCHHIKITKHHICKMTLAPGTIISSSRDCSRNVSCSSFPRSWSSFSSRPGEIHHLEDKGNASPPQIKRPILTLMMMMTLTTSWFRTVIAYMLPLLPQQIRRLRNPGRRPRRTLCQQEMILTCHCSLTSWAWKLTQS